ncbi:MAG: hypothetical protein QM698_14425 [Micropepsaceae bacterium]
MPTARLTDRAVLAVMGETAADFLQGLVTNDVTKLNPGSGTYAALLTPQGKIVTDFLVHAAPGGFHLDAPATHAADLLKRLKLYRLRAPVTLEDLSPTHAVFAAWGANPLPHPEEGALAPVSKDVPPDPRLHALGARWIAPIDPPPFTGEVPPQGAEGADQALAAYHAHRLALGVPDSADTEGQFALDANLEELHGLDFKKGCYVGQEVTARMKHKAAPRRRLARLVFDGPAPAPGTRLTGADGTEVGELKSGHGREAMASVRLNRITTTPQLSADGIPATVVHSELLQPALEAALSKATNE